MCVCANLFDGLVDQRYVLDQFEEPIALVVHEPTIFPALGINLSAGDKVADRAHPFRTFVRRRAFLSPRPTTPHKSSGVQYVKSVLSQPLFDDSSHRYGSRHGPTALAFVSVNNKCKANQALFISALQPSRSWNRRHSWDLVVSDLVALPPT